MRLTLPDRTASLVVAMAAFGLTATASRVLALVTVPLGVGFTLWAIYAKTDTGSSNSRGKGVIFVCIAVFALMTTTGPHHQVFGSPPRWVFAVTGVCFLVLGAWWALDNDPRRLRLILPATLALTAVTGAGLIVAAGEVGLDVLHLHKAAADAIAAGLSPYSEAVSVPNGAPGADPPFIVGYPYPPMVAIAYSLFEWVTGDPRWLSLTAWLTTLAMVGHRAKSASRPHLPTGVMLLMASASAWPLILTSGWTEPLSLLLLALAGWQWASPTVGGGLAGLAMGSKQYLGLMAPSLVTVRDPRRITRVTAAVLAVAVSLLPVLLWGGGDFLNAAVTFHLQTPPRTDGKSLVGLLDLFGITFEAPAVLLITGAVASGLILGRQARDAASWLSVSAAVLVVTFLLSSQALTNYWFLVMGVLGIAASLDDSVIAAAQRQPETDQAS